MKFLNLIIDKLQATFPPNRIAILLAGPIVAASAWISAFVATNVPGVELPVGIIAGIIGAAVLIVVTLLYKWFDQWQRGEMPDFEGDLELALEEFLTNPEARDSFIANHPELFDAIDRPATVAPDSSEPAPAAE